MASWIEKQFAIEAVPVRDVGLRDASDVQIFEAAKQADVVLVTKEPTPLAAHRQVVGQIKRHDVVSTRRKPSAHRERTR